MYVLCIHFIGMNFSDLKRESFLPVAFYLEPWSFDLELSANFLQLTWKLAYELTWVYKETNFVLFTYRSECKWSSFCKVIYTLSKQGQATIIASSKCSSVKICCDMSMSLICIHNNSKFNIIRSKSSDSTDLDNFAAVILVWLGLKHALNYFLVIWPKNNLGKYT